MTVFRKAVLERKKKHINGVLFDDNSKRQMRVILLSMLTIALLLLFLCQQKIKTYTVVKSFITFRGHDKKELCFGFEYVNTKKKSLKTGEPIGISLNKKEILTGTVSRIDDDSICVNIDKETNKELSPPPDAPIYLWKNEKLWFFLYNKIKGSTDL